MLLNYIKLAKRILINKFVFSLLNILGLAIGITASVLIFYYISFEKSFDKNHPDSDKTYRLTYGRTMLGDGSSVEFASACPAIAPLIKDNFPAIEKIARLAQREAVISYKEKKFIENKIYYAEQQILNILNFKLKMGTFNDVLSKPNNILINSTIAQKYFGESNPVGKILKLNNKESFQVLAVFEDIPENTHLKPEILISFPTLIPWRGKEYLQSWGHTGAFTYLTLKEDSNPEKIEKQIIEFTKKQIGEMLEHYNMHMYFKLQPIQDIHLKSNLLQEQETNGDEKTVNFLNIIGFFILIIAWVNYINLTTSRSMERAREVGVRKVIGASKLNLIKQFYIESALVNLAGIFLALVFIELIKPVFMSFTGISENFKLWNQNWFLLFMFLAFFIGTLLIGLYPAFALSSYKPVIVLKTKILKSFKGNLLRKILVIFQLIVSIVLITGTFAVFSQLKFMHKKNPGFDIENIVVFDVPRAIDSTYKIHQNSFIQELNKLSGVEGVAFSTEVPGRKIYWDNGGIFKVGDDPTSGKNYMIMGIDDKFIKLYKMELINGRNFSKDFPSDKNTVLINELAVKWFGFENPDSALGKQINYWDNIYTIIGVLENYNHESPKASFEPQIFRYLPGIPRGCFSVKSNKENLQSNINNIKDMWVKFFPGNPLDYYYLESYYNEQFKADMRFGNVFGIFSFLAIIVTCLGLFGLSLYTANLKTKEVSIRKVMGAKVFSILLQISKEYFYLILLSLIISIPVLLWGINSWLENFSTKMELNFTLFIIPVILVFLITMISVSSYTLRAAKLNPVKTLKDE